jgi:two-component system catabolic regulation response regulator CreB
MLGEGTFENPQFGPRKPQSSDKRAVRPVIVVEDEVELRAAVRDSLIRFGFDVIEAATIADARRLAREGELLLLDLGLPDGDGLLLCAELAGVLPIIVISARGDETDRVVALELGADDYLPKPFSTRELVARCRSVLRRTREAGPSSRVLSGDLEIDVEGLTVQRGGTPIELTNKEIELLVCLAADIGRLVRRSKLAAEVWCSDLGYVNRSIDVHVSSLRRKLGRRSDGSGYIETVHGVGYKLRA